MKLRIYPAPHDLELHLFSPRSSSLWHLTYVRLRGKSSRLHNSSSKQQQSPSNIFAVTVVVVALGHSLYCFSFPAAS